jgi:hypothetical protein
MAMRRIAKELRDLDAKPLEFCSAGPVGPADQLECQATLMVSPSSCFRSIVPSASGQAGIARTADQVRTRRAGVERYSVARRNLCRGDQISERLPVQAAGCTLRDADLASLDQLHWPALPSHARRRRVVTQSRHSTIAGRGAGSVDPCVL